MEIKSDYYNLQTELYRVYSRKRKLSIFFVAGIALGISAVIYGVYRNFPIINTIIIGLFITFFVFLILLMSSVALVNMNQSDYEEKMVQVGCEYLSKNGLSTGKIKIIEKRAEIGSSALSSRTTLSILTIPFLITFFSEKLSPVNQLFVAVVIITISMAFVFELDKANMDVLIRQICASYIPTKNSSEKQAVTEKVSKQSRKAGPKRSRASR